MGDQNPEVRIIAALICGALAFTSHAAKAGTRLSVNFISPAEPFSNIGLTLAEDAVAIGSLYFVYNHPFIALRIVAVLLLIIAWFAPKLWSYSDPLFQRRAYLERKRSAPNEQRSRPLQAHVGSLTALSKTGKLSILESISPTSVHRRDGEFGSKSSRLWKLQEEHLYAVYVLIYFHLRRAGEVADLPSIIRGPRCASTAIYPR